jgi:hypothetical protein
MGQRLVLSIENIRGGGGHRRIAVFCRYWIVNTTEHCLRYKQENSKFFVSGTVLSPDHDGSLPLVGGEIQNRRSIHSELCESDPSHEQRTIFAGMPGALATSPGRCELDPSRVAALLDFNLPLSDMTRFAFMFNFQEGSLLTIGHQKLCVQLGDGSKRTDYESDWSRGFSLDSVGISQIVW